MLTAAVIFAATYLVVALGRAPGIRLDRTGAAVVGAAFMVAFQVVTPERAYAMVDLGTLVLLFGTMVLVGHLRLAGFFRWVAAAVARRAASPRQMLAGLVAVAGLLSAVFVNDTICLALTPLVLEVSAALGVRATPYLLALATASNIGSTATLTGNPQNMLIGVASGVRYRDFFAALAPVALVGLVIDFVVIALVYRRELARPFPTRAEPSARLHPFLTLKSLAAAAAMIAWFFAGLFVVVGAAREAGVTGALFAVLHAREARDVASFAAAAAVLSNLVSNVPAVMLLIPLVPELPDPHRAWLTLAMASTLAGNLTVVGSIANLIVVEGARKLCPIGFAEYLKVGVPVTLLTLAAGVILMR